MATPEERIAALEARVNGIDAWLKDIDSKLDQLIAVANMGKGAWWAILKIGGLISVVVAAIVWVWQHIPWRA